MERAPKYVHHTRSSSFEGNVGVVYAKSAEVTGLVRDDRGRAVVAQFAIGMLVSFYFFAISCRAQPYTKPALNQIKTFS